LMMVVADPNPSLLATGDGTVSTIRMVAQLVSRAGGDGLSVGNLDSPDGGTIVAVDHLPEINPGLGLTKEGDWTMHPRYGRRVALPTTFGASRSTGDNDDRRPRTGERQDRRGRYTALLLDGQWCQLGGHTGPSQAPHWLDRSPQSVPRAE
jgi:hypothetical protein